MSKTRLGEALAERGVTYEHRRDLGTPPDIRRFYKHGRVAEGRALFAAHIAGEPALDELAAELTDGAPATALMCLEADPAECHRRVLAELLIERVAGLRVTDL